MPPPDTFHPGSNNWAVSGKHTADGRALVADDMHLGIRVPHIWYRASLVWPDAEGKSHSMTGVSLPGTPAIVVGSNGHVAWGFTNSEGDWVDVVIVEVDPDDKDSYLTPDGPRKFEHVTESIKVKDAADEKLEIVSTIWGPIIDHDHQGRPRAIRWVAHDPDGVNMGLMRMESADNLEDALRLANLSGSPAQNFVVADDQGRIAWTILGRIPQRVGFDGRLPTSWADGSHRWDGYLAPEEYPRIVDPEAAASGRPTRALSAATCWPRWATAATTWAPGPSRFATTCWPWKRPPRPTCSGFSWTIGPCFSSRGRSCCWTRSRPTPWPTIPAAPSCASWSRIGAAARRPIRSAFAPSANSAAS